MSLVNVTPELQNCIRNAMQNPYRFERTERFAMRQVLDRAEIEKVFVETARAALARQRVPVPAPVTTIVRAA